MPNFTKAAGRPIRPYLDYSGRVRGMLDQLQGLFDAHRRPRKADPPSFRGKCRRTMAVLCLNLTCLILSGRSLWLQTPSSKTWYAENRFWLGSDITASSVQACSDILVEAGLATKLDGRASSLSANRRSAGLWPSDKFRKLVWDNSISEQDVWRSPSQDLIQLRARKSRDGFKRRIPFQWDEELQRQADNLATINAQVQQVPIRLDVSDSQWETILDHISRKHSDGEEAEEATLDQTQRSLYRVYNNASFEQGGRFYGGWWQAVPKRWRPYINIAGSKVVELDYAAMHPTALSHRQGIPVRGRFYEIGIGNKPIVKATFNALINARGTSIKPVDGFDEESIGMTWSDFLKAVKSHYQPYRPYFGTGYGLRLQKLDSDIAETVMLHFVRTGRVVLPVHDSFLCAQADEAELAWVMEEEFRIRTGGTINLRRKRLSQAQINEIRARRALDRSIGLHP